MIYKKMKVTYWTGEYWPGWIGRTCGRSDYAVGFNGVTPPKTYSFFARISCGEDVLREVAFETPEQAKRYIAACKRRYSKHPLILQREAR